MNDHVTATFKTPGAAREAIDALIATGFMKDDISVLVTDMTRGKAFAIKEGTKAEEYTATGASAGGAFGAITALLISAALIPWGGISLIAIGPMFATLAGLGAGGLAGGVMGALIGMGVPEHEAKLYEDDVKDGKILIGVHVENEEESETAQRVLKDCDAVKIAA